MFPTRFDTYQAIQKHNLCGLSVILCLYNLHVPKQVLPPLSSTKKLSDITHDALWGTTKTTHNTNHKIKIKPSCICTAYTQQTALILHILMSIYFVELIPIIDCRLLSWGRPGLVVRALYSVKDELCRSP